MRTPQAIVDTHRYVLNLSYWLAGRDNPKTPQVVHDSITSNAAR